MMLMLLLCLNYVSIFHLHNLPEIFTDYFLSNKDIHNYKTRNAALLHKNSIGEITINTHLLTKEQMCGIIFHCNTKKLDLFLYLKRHCIDIVY